MEIKFNLKNRKNIVSPYYSGHKVRLCIQGVIKFVDLFELGDFDYYHAPKYFIITIREEGRFEALQNHDKSFWITDMNNRKNFGLFHFDDKVCKFLNKSLGQDLERFYFDFVLA